MYSIPQSWALRRPQSSDIPCWVLVVVVIVTTTATTTTLPCLSRVGTVALG